MPRLSFRFDDVLDPSEAEAFSWIEGGCRRLIEPIFSFALIFWSIEDLSSLVRSIVAVLAHFGWGGWGSVDGAKPVAELSPLSLERLLTFIN